MSIHKLRVLSILTTLTFIAGATIQASCNQEIRVFDGEINSDVSNLTGFANLDSYGSFQDAVLQGRDVDQPNSIVDVFIQGNPLKICTNRTLNGTSHNGCISFNGNVTITVLQITGNPTVTIDIYANGEPKAQLRGRLKLKSCEYQFSQEK